MSLRAPIGSCFSCRCRFALALLLALSLAGSVVAQSDLNHRRAQFERASNPVDRAKKFTKLGDAQFAAARLAVQREQYDEALHLLQTYRDEASGVHQALRAAVPNPEKKSSGFKQLEIHVRKSLRRLEDIIAASPLSRREPFKALRADLEKLNRELIRDLFPRQPGVAPKDKPQEQK